MGKVAILEEGVSAVQWSSTELLNCDAEIAQIQSLETALSDCNADFNQCQADKAACDSALSNCESQKASLQTQLTQCQSQPQGTIYVPDPKYPLNEPYNNIIIKSIPAFKQPEWGVYPSTTGDNWPLYYEKVRAFLPTVPDTTLGHIERAALRFLPPQSATGVDPARLGKAIAFKESSHKAHMAMGDFQAGGVKREGIDWGTWYQSHGITQLKRSVWTGTWPWSVLSTYLMTHFAFSIIRMNYDGQNWAPQNTQGSIWASVGAYFSGAGMTKAELESQQYVVDVKAIYNSQPWL
jgi:hypothetical protein